MSSSAAEAQTVRDTLMFYLGRTRAALWLTGARLGVDGESIVIQTPFEQVQRVLQRMCSAELKQAAEHLFGSAGSYRVEHVPGAKVPVNQPTKRKELF